MVKHIQKLSATCLVSSRSFAYPKIMVEIPTHIDFKYPESHASIQTATYYQRRIFIHYAKIAPSDVVFE